MTSLLTPTCRGQDDGAGAGVGCGHFPEADSVVDGHSGAGPSSQPASVRAEGNGSDPSDAAYMSGQDEGLALGSAAVMSQRRVVPLGASAVGPSGQPASVRAEG